MKQLKNLVIVFFLGLTLASAFIAGLPGLAVDPARADGPDEAQIIVQFDNGDVIVRKISFTAPISGYEALRLTGLDLITASNSFGLMICAIGGLGDSATNCFSTGFWSSYYWNGSTWQTYMVGAADSVINDGAIELWSWQPGFVPFDLPSTRPITAAANALDWLQTQQKSNGSYENDMNSSVEVLMAIGANKLSGSEWGSPTLSSYIFANSPTFAGKNAGAAGKLAVGLTAGGGCWPPNTKTPLDYYDDNTGKFSAGSLYHAWGILGTRALSQAVPAKAVEYLQSLQQSNGGWAWATSEVPDTNSTALAIQALLAAGQPVNSSAVISGLNYLDIAQNDDGGFPYDPDPTTSYNTASDTNSTAYVIQALLAAGEVLTDTRWTTSNGSTPLSYLLNRQLSNGSLEFGTSSGQNPGEANPMATWQAVPALLGKSFPLQQSVLHQCSQQELGLSQIYLPVVVK